MNSNTNPIQHIEAGSDSSTPKPEAAHEQPPANAFLRSYRKVYKTFGFNKGYNFPLYIIFAGAMLGFTLARFQYLSVGDRFAKEAAPGEWYWYRAGYYRIGITLHLGAILPAGFLMIFQFVPAIRYKALILHRINGWVIVLLVTVANVGALMIARRAFGGRVETQTGVGLLVILTTGGLTMAIYNIKKLQIDQHRAWMLRTMFWFGSIITMRIVQEFAYRILTTINSYYTHMSCDEIQFLYGGAARPVMGRYPQCFGENRTTSGEVAIHAQFNAEAGPEEAAAVLQLSFGLAVWVAIFLHTVGVEIYLALTPAESERLRCVSYEKQLEAGMSHPGSAGLTVDRFGDAPKWCPPVKG
ncbi:hypothetical protein W97_05592 [Coniosporium apollinis CBS 100218]|uniref:DUF2306 domain-containing protein n=1 Tax=Coniosporium apollinis (strain CBS 100218) TaxID=1168221 RepID=R7YWM3_CONA1|nr:uncharacterized protein W97_05592 [Coniosporium apollinis CBS 100218]EON66199.1 hypothetical protein W97_05592 [Coniosporium apollinis CBS 100218]